LTVLNDKSYDRSTKWHFARRSSEI